MRKNKLEKKNSIRGKRNGNENVHFGHKWRVGREFFNTFCRAQIYTVLPLAYNMYLFGDRASCSMSHHQQYMHEYECNIISGVRVRL